MDIRSGLEGLRSLLGVPQTTTAPVQPSRSGASQESNPLSSDRATLSSVGSSVAETAGDADVRKDKVDQIRTAIIAGTYSIPASAVAPKLVDTMLGTAK
jgi:flagellar biosynthesis anti-sigma factor FlgM